MPSEGRGLHMTAEGVFLLLFLGFGIIWGLIALIAIACAFWSTWSDARNGRGGDCWF